MATRSEEFRAEELRTHTGPRAVKARAKAKTRGEHVKRAKLDHATHETHNQAERTKQHSAYGLERGTRKSTRLGANRSKTDSSLRKTVEARVNSAKARSGRRD